MRVFSLFVRVASCRSFTSRSPALTRLLYALFAALLLSSAQTQESYFGVGGSYLASSAYGPVPLVSVQVGGLTAPAFGSFEARAALDTLVLFSVIGLDALASVRLPDASLRLYLGGGPDVLVFAPLDSAPGQGGLGLPVFLGLHGTAGLEVLPGVLTGGVRPYAELQPAAALLYGELVFGIRARAGLNVYF